MFIANLAAAQQTGGLTLHDIITDIPHDAAAFVVYALLLVSVGLIWKANRGKTKV